mmetsp:Transcript_36316/g.82786  ORF Transcript_36316/g.82786 Transcript_36316/m.82786 type:complete len:425 (+) Transcript_36316:381-1655(+)
MYGVPQASPPPPPQQVFQRDGTELLLLLQHGFTQRLVVTACFVQGTFRPCARCCGVVQRYLLLGYCPSKTLLLLHGVGHQLASLHQPTPLACRRRNLLLQDPNLVLQLTARLLSSHSQRNEPLVVANQASHGAAASLLTEVSHTCTQATLVMEHGGFGTQPHKTLHGGPLSEVLCEHQPPLAVPHPDGVQRHTPVHVAKKGTVQAVELVEQRPVLVFHRGELTHSLRRIARGLLGLEDLQLLVLDFRPQLRYHVVLVIQLLFQLGKFARQQVLLFSLHLLAVRGPVQVCLPSVGLLNRLHHQNLLPRDLLQGSLELPLQRQHVSLLLRNLLPRLDKLVVDVLALDLELGELAQPHALCSNNLGLHLSLFFNAPGLPRGLAPHTLIPPLKNTTFCSHVVLELRPHVARSPTRPAPLRLPPPHLDH